MSLIQGQGGDKKVKISLGDTNSDVLENKIVAGTGITITKLNTGADEDLEISLTGGGGQTDHHNGYTEIIASETITVVNRKQMTTHGGLTVHGALILNGSLVLKS